MPVATVEFLSMPGSLSSGEYPLLASSTQSLADYTVDTAVCKVLADLSQSITVPTFDNWDSVNMVRFSGKLWWVTDVRTSTNSDSSLIFDVAVNAPSSLLHDGDTVSGVFSRLPVNVCPYMTQQVLSGAMQYDRHAALPKLPTWIGISQVQSQVFWVQIVTTARLKWGSDLTAEEHMAQAEQDKLTQYGMFVVGDATNIIDSETMFSSLGAYPSLFEIVSDCEKLGIAASTITDISISCRCPFAYIGSGNNFRLADSFPNIHVVAPSGTGETDRYFYEFISTTSPPEPWSSEVTFTLEDFERSCGDLTLRSHTTAPIAVIPPAWGPTITAQVECLASTTQIVTRVTINGTIFVIEEGHLPYIGSSWAEYQAYSMAFDREAMQNSINFANERLLANSLQSISGGLVSGSLVGSASGPLGAVTGIATAGIGIIGNVVERSISERELRTNQALTEKRMQAQAGTPYNTGYGLMYTIQALQHPACIQLDMPSGIIEDDYIDYCNVWGYPCENPRDFVVQAGYMQGKILSGSERGPLFDKANMNIQNGIRFLEVI